ncbi:uncharacterized protein [Drosophila pseudoobscura]|uniref:Uncharacterized protein n=1 Tax=Drosophila pseudoobscura pseudoobscura TaxID=46245 RepID=Q2LZI4_DROPS|nr:uncharacterized protein LOC4813792 [Drosophila pseudoobscura]
MAKTKNSPCTIRKRLEQQVAILRRELASARVDQNDISRKYAARVRQQAGSGSFSDESLKLKKRIKILERENHEQNQYISYLEEQIKLMPAQYESRMVDLKKSAKLAERELNKVYHGMRSIKEQIKQVDKLKDSVAILKARLERRDFIIAHYEAQNSKKTVIVEDLQGHQKSESRHKKCHTTTPTPKPTSEPTDVTAESETEPQGSLLVEKYKKLDNIRAPLKHKLKSVDFCSLAAALRMKGKQSGSI